MNENTVKHWFVFCSALRHCRGAQWSHWKSSGTEGAARIPVTPRAMSHEKLQFGVGLTQLRLSSKGYQFLSQTDTELLAHLVQDSSTFCHCNTAVVISPGLEDADGWGQLAWGTRKVGSFRQGCQGQGQTVKHLVLLSITDFFVAIGTSY